MDKIYNNDLPNSSIKSVITHISIDIKDMGPRFLIQNTDNSFTEVEIEKLAIFLNEATGANEKKERIISKQIENNIVHDFAKFIKFENNKYLFKGEIKPKTSKERVKDYKQAPHYIARIGRSEVIDESGLIWPIGITPTRISLDVTKIGGDKSEQSKLSGIICGNAFELSLLPHLNYKNNIYEEDSLNGVLSADHFDRVGRYNFSVKQDVDASLAIKSIFKLEKRFILECSMAIQIILYKSILDFIGEDKFNQMFLNSKLKIEAIISKSNPLTNFFTVYSGNYRSIAKDPEELIKLLVPGEVTYINNIAPYRKRHLFGESAGFNLIYLGNNDSGQHIFGGLFSTKHTHHYDDIIDHMIDDYNKIPYDIIDNSKTIETSRPMLIRWAPPNLRAGDKYYDSATKIKLRKY